MQPSFLKVTHTVSVLVRIRKIIAIARQSVSAVRVSSPCQQSVSIAGFIPESRIDSGSSKLNMLAARLSHHEEFECVSIHVEMESEDEGAA